MAAGQVIHCFVHGCQSQYYKNACENDVQFFKVPPPQHPDILWHWKRQLSRGTRVFNPRKHRVCEKHFLPEFIVKEDKVNGKLVPRLKEFRTLTEYAVPTIVKFKREIIKLFPKSKPPKTIYSAGEKKIPEARPPIKTYLERRKRLATVVVRELDELQDYDMKKVKLEAEDEYQFQSQPSFTNIKDLIDEWNKQEQESQWMCKILTENNKPVAYFVSLISDTKAVIEKQVRVNETLEYQVFFMDSDVTTFFTSDKRLAIQSVSDINRLLVDVTEKRLCQGLTGFSNVKFNPSGHKIGDKWFSRSCDGIGICKVCVPCKHLFHSLNSGKYDLSVGEVDPLALL